MNSNLYRRADTTNLQLVILKHPECIQNKEMLSALPTDLLTMKKASIIALVFAIVKATLHDTERLHYGEMSI